MKFTVVIIFFLIATRIYAACIGLGCSCTVSATSAVGFLNYNPLSGSAVTSNGSVSVTCSALIVGLNVSYTIALNPGLYGTFSARKMNLSTYYLQYNLYTASNFSSIWGDGTAGTALISDSYILNLISSTRVYTVYGNLPGSQNVIFGTYNDSVTVTVTY